MKPQTLLPLLATLILAGCASYPVPSLPPVSYSPPSMPAVDAWEARKAREAAEAEAREAAEARAGAEFLANLDSEMMPIPAGTFMMGSPDDEWLRGRDEVPQHQVTITKPFWLGKTEVTQLQWRAVMGNNHESRAIQAQKVNGGLIPIAKEDNLPVKNVLWDDAVAFCEKLNEIKRDTLPDGYHYTLPTEAQWEYACRAGTTTLFYYGDERKQLGQYAWYEDNSSYWKEYRTFFPRPVGEKIPNSWGLYGMHGNVREMCLDWYGDYTWTGSGFNLVDPQGPQSGTHRVARGGDYFTAAKFCRSASRHLFRPTGPNSRATSLGFRVALSSVPSE